MKNQLDEAALTYMELDAKHYLERPIDREQLQQLIEEVRTWRSLGDDPDDVAEHIEALQFDLQMAQDEASDLRRELAMVTGEDF